jgi:uncharacterized protein YjiS (DUF1127 family)
MPCGNTPRNSTNTLDAVSPACPASSRHFWKILLSWLAGAALWWVWGPQHRQLHELDDWLLADIGMSRTAAKEVRRTELYQSAWRDSK